MTDGAARRSFIDLLFAVDVLRAGQDFRTVDSVCVGVGRDGRRHCLHRHTRYDHSRRFSRELISASVEHCSVDDITLSQCCHYHVFMDQALDVMQQQQQQQQ